MLHLRNVNSVFYLFKQHKLLIFVSILPFMAYGLAFMFVPQYLCGFRVIGGIRTAIVLLVIAPALEELVFRGLLQEYLQSKIPNKLLVVLMVNVVFSGSHYHVNHGAGYLFLVFACGILFSGLKLRYGKLMQPVLIHAYYNGSLYLLSLSFELCRI